ncbi:hypothetical protein QP140_07700 [Corynebacterium sp. UMB9976]|uniref:hypothetical protein n=1 Tax=Corynebacterium sp. UMB9976 TaxID=3046354 RepID=UPI00254FAA78|nr:hypothetical protein [Corynebacterium sp. UMB9976]MDK6302473.1 hypothetical protein [Corynebacterium sp. UMB9976]
MTSILATAPDTPRQPIPTAFAHPSADAPPARGLNRAPRAAGHLAGRCPVASLVTAPVTSPGD